MDTRSRRFRYSRFLKCVAFFLAAVCVFAAVWNAAEALKTLYDYGLESTLVQEQPQFIKTSHFRMAISRALDDLDTAYLHNSWEEDGLPKYKTLEQTKKEALEAFAVFREETLRTAIAYAAGYYDYNTDGEWRYDYGSEVWYYHSYDDGTDNYVTNAYNENADLVEAAKEEEYYQKAAMHYVLTDFDAYVYFSTDMTETDVEAQITKVYKSALAAQKRAFAEKVAQATADLEELVNFQYLLVQPETGTVHTNMAGVQTATDFFAQFQTDRDWYFGYTAEGGLVRTSEVMMDSYRERRTFYYDAVVDFCDAGYDVYICVPMPLKEDTGDTFYAASVRFAEESGRVEQKIINAGILGVCALLISVYLLLVTGRMPETAEVRLSPLDRMPTDLHFLLSGGLLVLIFFSAVRVMESIFEEDTAAYYVFHGAPILRALVSLLGVAFYSVLLEWGESVAKYNKAEKPYFKSMLLVRAFRGVFRFARKLRKTVFYRFRHMTKKAWVFLILYVGVNAVLFLMLTASFYSGLFTVFLLMCIAAVNLIALIVLWKHLVALDKIIEAAKMNKTGEMPQNIGAERMPEPLQSLARDLIFTQDEMQKAVAEAVKGERMKTELITNVSHDLKTPLTSIISYVDLLKKCDITDDNAQKYITVLDEKSIRLKRLIEDLVEASKASSGAVTLNKMRVDLYQLAVQAIGEMEDGFIANGLQIVLDEPTGSTPVIYVDSQKTWRIIDNLLGNARKYSLQGSRVYVRVFEQGNFGVFEMKNISSKALNIDPDELTQRFVRGDSARTEEGSGLGLSIAKDLCTLQGGLLKIQIDGDLFKVTVALPLAPAMPQSTTTAGALNGQKMKGQG